MPAHLLDVDARVRLAEPIIQAVADMDVDEDVALAQLAGVGLTASPAALHDAAVALRRYADVDADYGAVIRYVDVPLGCSLPAAADRFKDEQQAEYEAALAELATPAHAPIGGAA